jgi:dephospho-CoA kinase
MIIGITGTLGAGKGTVAQILVDNGFTHMSVRNLLIQKLQQEQKEINRDTMHELSNRLRKTFGPQYMVVELIKQAANQSQSQNSNPNIIIESIRSTGEVAELKKQGGILLAVDAPIRTRYERIIARASETDKVSFEKFCADEQSEQNKNEFEQNLSGCIALADIVIQNDGDITHLKQMLFEELKNYNITQTPIIRLEKVICE